nr:hypothetical protein [uncultured Halomonas sp.]
MFNRSRKIACPDCGRPNVWKGVKDPAPSAELHCRYCGSFITTHEDYLRGMVRQEVASIMARYADPDSSYQLALLKTALSKREQVGVRY